MARRKVYILLTIVITLWLQSACARTPATAPAPQNVSPEAVATAISESDALFRQRDNIANLRTAAAALARLRQPDHRTYAVEWHYAKICYFLGLGSTDEKERQTSFEKGRDAGRIAANMEPESPDGHFWYGANLGELARMNPVTVGLKSVDDIKAEMNKVIELDPRYQNTAAYDVLAQVELGTTMFGGSPDKAVELLEKALSLEQDNAQVRLHLGQAYLAARREKEAKAQLEAVVKMAPDPDYLPEHAVCVAEATKMLKTRF